MSTDKTQYQNKQYDPTQFKARQFPGGGIEPYIPPTPSGCNGVYYASRVDIELIFGKSNTSKWADVDNNEDQDFIDARICWSLAGAEAYLNDMLAGGPHRVPIEKVDGVYPTQLIVECARKAGTILYDSRGVTDVDADGRPQDSLKMHREQTARFISRIHANQLILTGVPIRTNTPGVAEDYPTAPDNVWLP